MAGKRWKLMGQAPDSASEGPGFSHQMGDLSVGWHRNTTGLSAGVDILTLDSGSMRVAVLPTRGMGIWRATSRDVNLGWHSPIRGPVHPQFVPLFDPSGLGWLDGFDEFLCRCGLSSNGAPEFDAQGRLQYPLHGRIANRPAHEVTLSMDDSAGQLQLTGVVDETRFHFQKLRLTSTITLYQNRDVIELEDVVQNLSGSPAIVQVLYHINYGPPLLGAGSRLVAPVARVMPNSALAASQLDHWNSFQGPHPGVDETVYFTRLHADAAGNSQVMLTGPHGDQAAAIEFSVEQLPCFTLWKNETAWEDGYVTGLEPGTNFPNRHTFERGRGRMLQLPAGGQRTLKLTLAVDHQREAVERRSAAIAALQAGRETVVERAPAADWCEPV